MVHKVKGKVINGSRSNGRWANLSLFVGIWHYLLTM